ncbi:MAG: hypothetical protein HOQ22_01040 [Nocardioidaceae bacterium]|nr:hypothetical protein [Nocardioidaceae bacterium]NUS49614.1 hypothetical protein [Nocardioidaceae bacterium]
MSESPEQPKEPPETGLIPDEDLPDDLNPEENPLARDPDEDPSADEED